MKKVLIGLFTFVLALSLISPVCAEDFTPSISGGKIPGIVTENKDGKEVVGYVVEDATGEVLSTVYTGCLYVVSLQDAQDPTSDISAAHRNELIDLNEKFSKGEINLGDGLVARDLFLADLIDDCKDWLEKPGTSLTITFEMNVAAGTDLQVATFINGQWQFVKKVVINNDGTVSVTFEDLCPIVFLVKEKAPLKPGGTDTGDKTNVALLLAMLAGSALVLLKLKKAH